MDALTSPSRTTGPPTSLVRVVLLAAVLAISTSAIIVRLAGGAHPLLLAFWRTAGGAALLLPWTTPRVTRADAGRIFLAGGCLAAHFATWFFSLEHTTVMRSTVLVTLAPIWAGILELFVLRSPPKKRFWAGMGLAIPGVLWMSWAPGGSAGSTQGDLLALLGGAMSGAYLVLGRTARQRVPLTTYAALTYASAAAWLVPAIAYTGLSPTHLDSTGWMAVVALVLVPQTIGHTALNWSLGTLPAATVGAVTLLEPVGATLLGTILLKETPTASTILGAITILSGAFLAMTGKQKPTRSLE